MEIAEKPEGALELMDEQNERLEFLGDTILSSVVGKYLFQRYPTEDEGFMTRMRTKLVNGETLSKFAKELNLKGHKIMRPDQPIGGAQAIIHNKLTDTLVGGSDPRKDGFAIGY